MNLRSNKLRTNYPLFISLLLHVIALSVLAGYPITHAIQKKIDSMSVEWVKDVPPPKLKEAEPPKQPLQMNFKPIRDIDPGSKKKRILATDNQVAFVLKRSEREVERNVEINKFPQRSPVPNLMTAAQINDSDIKLSSLVSTEIGPVDGRGIVSNQVRAKGTGGQGDKSGASILGLGGKGSGLYGDGLGGGSGEGGGAGKPYDRLGLIKFLEESGGKNKVVYLLDVSASMAIGSKLDMSVKAIQESLLQLEDTDLFNIVVFYAEVRKFKDQMIPATMDNVKKAIKFLNSFTPRNIENNMGTDILGALKFAISLDPEVIVLVTDVQPTRGEVDEEKIAEELEKINTSARIYGVGIEVWEPSPNGRLAKLLRLLTKKNNGEMKLVKAM